MTAVRFLIGLAAGCSAPHTAAVDCVGSESGAVKLQAPLNGGVPTAAYLGASSAELDGVLSLTFHDASGVELAACTGTLISPSWVLTAAHCDAPGWTTIQLSVLDGNGQVARTSKATRSTKHPRLDLMLVEVAPADLDGIVPIPVAEQPVADPTGQRVQLAGTGYNPELGLAARLFAVSTIVAARSETFVVDAMAYAGACSGDSGGPLLVRGSNGGPVVLGVLSAGDITCWSQDEYVRIDAGVDWISGVVGPAPESTWSCGELDATGRCFNGLAAWCEMGTLKWQECEAPTKCGFGAGRGFRCLSAAAADPCDGIGDLGSCDDGDAVECVNGHLRRNVCSQCGAACVISPRTGRAVCVE